MVLSLYQPNALMSDQIDPILRVRLGQQVDDLQGGLLLPFGEAFSIRFGLIVGSNDRCRSASPRYKVQAPVLQVAPCRRLTMVGGRAQTPPQEWQS